MSSGYTYLNTFPDGSLSSGDEKSIDNLYPSAGAGVRTAQSLVDSRCAGYSPYLNPKDAFFSMDVDPPLPNEFLAPSRHLLRPIVVLLY